MLTTTKKRATCEVLEVRRLTAEAAVVRFERNGLEFEAGQYVRVGVEGDAEIRDYSIYSGAGEEYVEVLVRRVEEGLVSKQLCDLEVGESVEVGGPYGHFRLLEETRQGPLLLIATGTGISPYHNFFQTYPGLDARVIHGTAREEEAYEAAFYGDRYFHCVSRGEGGDFHGRVTDYLRGIEIPAGTNAFLCGNCDMIYEAFDLLQAKGLPTAQIHTEVYF